MSIGASSVSVIIVATPTTFSNSLVVRYMRWVGATTAGHQLVVQSKGVNIFESVADGANFIDVHPFFDLYQDLDITTIQSGKLYIYLG